MVGVVQCAGGEQPAGGVVVGPLQAIQGAAHACGSPHQQLVDDREPLQDTVQTMQIS